MLFISFHWYYQCYLSCLIAIIVFSSFITEVISVISDVDSDVTDVNLHSVNIVNKLESSSMKNLHVNCLDQLILVVHLPDVSVTITNDFHCLL